MKTYKLENAFQRAMVNNFGDNESTSTESTLIARFMGPTWGPSGSWGHHGAHLGPVGPRWSPCWPHEPCYQGKFQYDMIYHSLPKHDLSNVLRKSMMICVCTVYSTAQNNLCINKLWIIHKVVPVGYLYHCCYFSFRNFIAFVIVILPCFQICLPG